MIRGGLRVYGALYQLSVRGSRALKKNVVGCGCVLDALLFIGTNEDREWKTRFRCTRI
jgi:hypothetical protein